LDVARRRVVELLAFLEGFKDNLKQYNGCSKALLTVDDVEGLVALCLNDPLILVPGSDSCLRNCLQSQNASVVIATFVELGNVVPEVPELFGGPCITTLVARNTKQTFSKDLG